MPFCRGYWDEMLFSELIQRGTTRWRQIPAMSGSYACPGPPPAQTLCLGFPAPALLKAIQGFSLAKICTSVEKRGALTHWYNFGGPAAKITEDWFISPLEEAGTQLCVRVSCLSYLTLCDPVGCSHQALLSVGFLRQGYWSGLPLPSAGDLPDPGTEPESPALQADSFLSEPPGKPL